MAFGRKKKKEHRENEVLRDPLGLDRELPAAAEEPAPAKGRRLPGLFRGKTRIRGEKVDIVRVENLRRALEEAGEDVDVDTVVSLYLPQRRARRFGAALLRLGKLRLLLAALLLVLLVLFLLAFSQEKMGNFTINLNRLEMYRKGISIADNGAFENATARLQADAGFKATNISVRDLPEDLDLVDGSHNGKNYMAYTYYVRNAGKEDTYYDAVIRLDASAKGAEKAARVAVWHNGERIIYAAPAADGTPEPGCVSFQSEKLVCTYHEPRFLVGNVDRYTVVIWMEGDDPECVDDIVGGSVQFSMSIDADNGEKSSLLAKFVGDIVDTLTGNKPIYGSSDSAVPDYYRDNEVTWATRRNQ